LFVPEALSTKNKAQSTKKRMSSALKTPPSLTARSMLSSPEVERALSFFEKNAEAITEEQIQMCQIPAPPFGERERAEYHAQKISTLGLTEV
jgi:hypothetical protein